MAFQLPPLPWDKSSLKLFSAETIDYHYGKHHAGYVTKLNGLAANDEDLAKRSLEDIIVKDSGKTFNLAAQIWNHTFFWESLSPNGGGAPTGALGDKIVADFGSYENFQSQFFEEGNNHFGSGWVWLVNVDPFIHIIFINFSDSPFPR